MALLKFKRSAVPAKVPALNDLALGELAINTYDGKVYTKKDNGTASIVEVGGGGGVTSFNTRTGAVTLSGGDVTTALGYTPASTSGPTFSNGMTVNNGGNQVLIAYDGNLEIVRAAGGAYIDFKDSTAEDFDVRLQASGNQLNIAAAGGLTLNGAGVLTGITSGQVTTALGYTPANKAGDTFTGSVTIPELFVSDNTPTFTSGAFQYHLHQSPHVAYVKQTGGYNWYWRRNSTGTLSGADEVEDMSLTEGGNLIVRSDVRAPLFYDTPNTAWYLDPSNTSNLNLLNVGGGPVFRASDTTRFQSGSDFVDGTLVTTDIPATAWAGDSFVIEITGKSYNQDNPPFKVVAQGYLYNDTIINYSGISYAGNFATYIKVFQDGGVLKFWWPRISYWNSFNVNVMSMDGQTNGTITRNRVTAIGNSTEPTGTKKQQINLARFMRGDVSATNSVDVRAPIFYDTPDTSWFLDPSGTSVLNVVRANAIEHVNGTDAIQLTDGSYLYFRSPDNGIRMYLGGADPANYYDNDTHFFRNRATAIRAELTSNDGFKIGPNTSGQYTRLGGNGGAADMCTVSASNGNFHIDAKTGNNLYLSWYNVATTYVGGEIAATVFRDRDNSAFYVNADSTSRLERLVLSARYDNYFVGSMAVVNAVNNFQLLTDTFGQMNVMQVSDTSGFTNGPTGLYPYGAVMSWRTENHSYQMYASHTGDLAYKTQWNNDNYTGWQTPVIYGRIGNSASGRSIYGGVYYDSDDTAYYLDPFSTGLALRVNGNMECYARSAAWSEGYRVRVPSRATWGGIRFTRDDANSNGNWAIGFTGIDSTDDLTFWGNLNGAEGMRARLTQTGNFSITGASVAYSYQGNGNVGGTGSASWHPSGIYSAGYNWLYGGISAGNADISSVNNYYGNAYYDSGDTSTYVNPNGVSWIKGNFNISRVSPLGDNDCFGGLELREVSLVANTNTAATYSPRVNFHWGAVAAATIFMNSGGNFVFGGQSDITNNRRSIFCNELYATGNVTAYYSDDRLKTRIGNIENALDIVSSLNGFRYVDNDLAKTFGYTNENGQIGVSAQEVQKHLPEIVRPAAFDVDHDNPDQGSKTGENYLTVDYSRLVPLLIEAIKELRGEVEALKNRS